MNRFKTLSQEEKMEMLELSVAEAFNRGYKYAMGEMVVDKPDRVEAVKAKKKSNNQQRKELIEEAENGTSFLTDGRGQNIVYWNTNGKSTLSLHTLTFHINKQEGVTVAVIKDSNGKMISKGISRCMKDDVFNEHIGKFIAYRRAVELDVEEKFLDPIQPDKVVVGMDIKWKFDEDYYTILEEEGCSYVFHNYIYRGLPEDKMLDGLYYEQNDFLTYFKIVDDTHAKY